MQQSYATLPAGLARKEYVHRTVGFKTSPVSCTWSTRLVQPTVRFKRSSVCAASLTMASNEAVAPPAQVVAPQDVTPPAALPQAPPATEAGAVGVDEAHEPLVWPSPT